MEWNKWIAETVRDLVGRASENQLPDFGGQCIFDTPLVGVAHGDDPLFERFQEAVSPRHLLPREILRQAAPEGGGPVEVRVIAWALPFAAAVRRSNRGRSTPSALYSLARNNGGALNHVLRERLTHVLRQRGFRAVAPVLTDHYDAFRCAQHTFSSTWSERHVAFAAGLGQFGLNGCLITRAGSTVRLGSVVTDLALAPTPRPEDYRAPCLALGGAKCGRCIERCPVGAISSGGLDKSRCYEMRQAVRERFVERYSRDFHMLSVPVVKGGKRTHAYSLGCALCQCGVPCESRFPADSLELDNEECST